MKLSTRTSRSKESSNVALVILSAAQARTVSGGCSQPSGCTSLYQPNTMPSFNYAWLGSDITPPTPTFYLPTFFQ